jgi:hypothetical protein
MSARSSPLAPIFTNLKIPGSKTNAKTPSWHGHCKTCGSPVSVQAGGHAVGLARLAGGSKPSTRVHVIADHTEGYRDAEIFAAALLSIGVVAAPALAKGLTEAELKRAATDLGARYDANYAAKDPAAMAMVYAEDGVLVSPPGPIVRGRDAIKATTSNVSPPERRATRSRCLKCTSRATVVTASTGSP